jgi:hypothetical protein
LLLHDAHGAIAERSFCWPFTDNAMSALREYAMDMLLMLSCCRFGRHFGAVSSTRVLSTTSCRTCLRVVDVDSFIRVR